MRKKQKHLIRLSAVFTMLGLYTIYKFNQPPRNRPKCYKRKSNDHRVVACLGDSNTQGTMAYNFVNDLSESMAGEGYEFINAGVNGDLVYNVLNRLDEVILCDPDYIIILIGTNDILAQLNKPNEIKFELKKQLPMKPNEVWFIANLTAVIDKLKVATHAKIAILSLPLISEDTDSTVFKQAVEYSHQIQKIAESEQITYLPLNEYQLKFLEECREGQGKKINTSPFAFFVPSFKHYVLRKSWDQISKEAGLVLTVDTIHQNEKAASIIEGLVRSFLESQQ